MFSWVLHVVLVCSVTAQSALHWCFTPYGVSHRWIIPSTCILTTEPKAEPAV